MQRLSALVFGALAPLLEVLLVLVGLGVLGWQGIDYTLTGHWPDLTMQSLWLAQPMTDGVLGWFLELPVSGVCFAAAAGLFFLMPASYAHA